MKANKKESKDIKSAQYWIDKFQLEPHPEGGYFKQIYRSQIEISSADLPDRFAKDRSIGTVIYYLLDEKTFSAFHRLKSDEIWFFLAGDSLLIHKLQGADVHTITLDPKTPSMLIPSETWFAAETESSDSFALVSCVVIPGFDFSDFELAEKNHLKEIYPNAAALIDRLTIKEK